MRHPGDVLSRFDLLEQVWGYDYENRSNIVEVYVRYLREKIDRPFGRNTPADRQRSRIPGMQRTSPTPPARQARSAGCAVCRSAGA